MSRKLALVAALGAAVCFATSGRAAPATPDAGTYLFVSQVTAVSDTCNDQVGTLGAGTFHYPGHNQAGTTVYVPSGNQFAVNVFTLSKTPGLGVKTWHGTFTRVKKPGGGSKNGSFTATFTFIDTSTFLLEITTDESDNGCTETTQLTLLKTS